MVSGYQLYPLLSDNLILPSSLKTCLITALNVGSRVPAVLSTCTLDFTTSAGKMATHKATPPKPPDMIVYSGPEKHKTLVTNMQEDSCYKYATSNLAIYSNRVQVLFKLVRTLSNETSQDKLSVA